LDRIEKAHWNLDAAFANCAQSESRLDVVDWAIQMPLLPDGSEYENLQMTYDAVADFWEQASTANVTPDMRDAHSAGALHSAVERWL